MSESAGDSLTDVFADVTRRYGHLPCFRQILPLVVRSNPHTYMTLSAASGPLEVTWLELAMHGLERLRRRRRAPVRSAAVLGTGGGLDAVGISRIFAPVELFASDIHPAALDAARWNIERLVLPGTRVRILESDLFRQYPDGVRFDLVFENLPNVPDPQDLLEGIRAASCYRPADYQADPVSDRALLGLHYNCLLEARSRLRPGGSVVAMIGGRVPWETIREIFARAGYDAQVLHFALKRQSEAGVVLEGYARAERNGAPAFAYYHPVEAVGTTQDGRAGEPEPAEVAAQLNAALLPYQVTASQALQLHRRGEAVCHSVYVIEGRPAPPESGPGERKPRQAGAAGEEDGA